MRKNLGKFVTMLLVLVLGGTGWLSAGSADASPEEPRVAWSAEFRGSSGLYDDSAGEAVAATSDGHYVVVGRTYSSISEGQTAYAVKLNPQGEVIWERELAYRDPYGYMSNGAFEVIETSDGHILIGGEVRDGGYGRPRYVPYFVKLTQNGEVVWQKAYLDMPFYFQSANVIAETADGNYVITGKTYRSSGEVPAYLLKIDADGTELWSRTYSIGYEQSFDNLVVTSDNGVIVSGQKNDRENGPKTPVLLKVNAHGEIVWRKTQEIDPIDSILAASGGNYVLTRHNPDTHSYYLQNLASSGNPLGTKPIGMLPGEGTRSVVRSQVYDEGYALIAELRPVYNKAVYQLIVLDASGEQVNHFVLDSPDLRSVGKGIVAPDGGFLLTGKVARGSKTFMEVIKVAPPGSPTEPVLTNLAFQPDRMELHVGQTASSVVNAVYSDASVTDVTYLASFESADPSIALVDGTGKVTGVSPGRTIVTASYEGMRASLTVEVKEGAPGFGRFYLDSEEYSVSVGAKLDTAAYFADEDGRLLLVTKDTVFETADPAIATIDEDGNIRGISPGITWITATYHGHSFRASVWVVRPYGG